MAWKVAVTGFPGWLTSALFARLLEEPGNGLTETLLLVHPESALSAREGSTSFHWQNEVVPFDLACPRPISEALEGVDTLVHTAAVIHVRRTSDWYRVNTEGTIALAVDARRAGVRRFVYISSIAAAGRSPKDRTLSESDPPRPLHHYGRSKLLAEQALQGLHEAGRFEVIVLRPSMFYGPPVPLRHVEIYRRILHGRMPLVGGGEYARSLVHIDNLVQATLLAMRSPNGAGETYFIVDRPAYTTRSIVEAMAEALGARARYIHLPHTLAEIAYQIDRAVSAFGLYVAPIHLLGEAHWNQAASCEKAMHELGYDPKVSLRVGMRGAVAWCRRHGVLA